MALLVLANILFWGGRQLWKLIPGDPIGALPPVMLWAWERPEDLSFLDCRQAGIAFLAQTIVLEGGEMNARPRMQPMKVPEGCSLVAVVRIESKDRALSDSSALAARIAKLAVGGRVAAVQVDFDAAESERCFYRSMLEDLRRRLPKDVGLSITALASHLEWVKNC